MIETERLKMRKLTADDLPWLIEMRSDPDVYKYLGGWEKQNPEAVTKRFEVYQEYYRTVGFAQCLMELKSTGERIGCSGLQPLEDTGEIEVGYNLSKKFWRQGYGEECARGWLKYGFETLGLERIVAVADPANTGSWRIMEKCGMTYVATEEHYGFPCVVYEITRDAYLSQPMD
ncbi:MAG: GNAT family N-acetyltransferase [Acidobacteriota bacterium]